VNTPGTQPSYVNLPTLLGDPEIAHQESLYQLIHELRVAIPVVVVSFDAVHQTVTVQPAIQENVFLNLVPTPVNLPQLINVPVCPPRGGGFSITFPFAAGDEGFVVFQDMCYDAWWQSGGTENNQVERRRHDLSDAMFIPGGWSQPRILNNYSTTGLQLRSDGGNTVIEIDTGQVTVTPDGGTTQIKIAPGEIDLTATLVKINGTNFHSHIHSGVTTGAGVTGPVTP
jgi:hypothetical protein